MPGSSVARRDTHGTMSYGLCMPDPLQLFFVNLFWFTSNRYFAHTTSSNFEAMDLRNAESAGYVNQDDA